MPSEAQVAAGRRTAERYEQRNAEIAQEILWMRRFGVHPEWWPEKLGVPSLEALEKRMRKRPELPPEVRTEIEQARRMAGQTRK